MKNLVVIFFAFIHSILFSQSISPLGQINPIPTAVPFLLITPDARAGGMGDAGCASTPDVWSNYWNASKNVFAEKNCAISFSYTPWLRQLVPDINLADVSVYKKIGKKNTIGLSGRYFSFGDITYSAVAGSIIGQYHPYEHTESIFFSHKMRHNFSFGIAGKYIYSQLASIPFPTQPGQAIAIDVSCYKRDTVNFIKTGDVFAWGVNISNVGSKISYDNSGRRDLLPQSLRIGISYKMNMDAHNSIELICDANKLLVPTPTPASQGSDQSVISALFSSFHDAPGGYQEELREINIASGIEYWYAKILAVRMGYFYEDPTKGGRKYITLGVGGRFESFELDLSYLIPTEVRNPLQNTMRITLAYEFGLHEKEMKKDKSPHFIE